MTAVTITRPAELYKRLQAEAKRRGQPAEVVAQTWVTERLAPSHPDAPSPAPPGERERVTSILRAAGRLTELSTEEKAHAARSSATLEEVNAALERAGGKPLSEVILEMRGPKE